MTTYLKLVFFQARVSIKILEIEEKISKEIDYDRYLLSKNFAPSF